MRGLRSQEEIMASWKGDLSKPVVSICCISYNHESFIEDALEGFLIQETDFPYEILIHDDASTDLTADIIREYENRYPKLIKAIYQKENQYLKIKKINFAFNFTRAVGDYIALCEGDDYWFDKHKLSKQVLNLQCNPSFFLTCAPSYIDCVGGEYIGKIASFDKRIKPSSVIMGGGDFVSTPSILFMTNKLDEIPAALKKVNVGDLLIQTYMAFPKGVLFTAEPMSVYRKHTPGSWTDRNNKASKLISNRLAATAFYFRCAYMYPKFAIWFVLRAVKINLGLLKRLTIISFRR